MLELIDGENVIYHTCELKNQPFDCLNWITCFLDFEGDVLLKNILCTSTSIAWWCYAKIQLKWIVNE